MTGGAIDVTIGRRTQTVGPGGFVHVPPERSAHDRHTRRGLRGARMELGRPSDRDVRGPANSLPAGLPTPDLFPQVVEISTRHGLQMLTPVDV